MIVMHTIVCKDALESHILEIYHNCFHIPKCGDTVNF